MFRKATTDDISRIAEIIIFTKRHTYRPIFQNDNVSFNEMQVISEAKRLSQPNELNGVYVYDDGIVKAMIKIEQRENELFISDFYVDNFFQSEGIGRYILRAIEKEAANCGKKVTLCVLDKNTKAIEFYEKYGFKYTQDKHEFENSGFYLLKYIL